MILIAIQMITIRHNREYSRQSHYLKIPNQGEVADTDAEADEKVTE